MLRKTLAHIAAKHCVPHEKDNRVLIGTKWWHMFAIHNSDIKAVIWKRKLPEEFRKATENLSAEQALTISPQIRTPPPLLPNGYTPESPEAQFIESDIKKVTSSFNIVAGGLKILTGNLTAKTLQVVTSKENEKRQRNSYYDAKFTCIL